MIVVGVPGSSPPIGTREPTEGPWLGGHGRHREEDLRHSSYRALSPSPLLSPSVSWAQSLGNNRGVGDPQGPSSVTQSVKGLLSPWSGGSPESATQPLETRKV